MKDTVTRCDGNKHARTLTNYLAANDGEASFTGEALCYRVPVRTQEQDGTTMVS